MRDDPGEPPDAMAGCRRVGVPAFVERPRWSICVAATCRRRCRRVGVPAFVERAALRCASRCRHRRCRRVGVPAFVERTSRPSVPRARTFGSRSDYSCSPRSATEARTASSTSPWCAAATRWCARSRFGDTPASTGAVRSASLRTERRTGHGRRRVAALPDGEGAPRRRSPHGGVMQALAVPPRGSRSRHRAAASRLRYTRRPRGRAHSRPPPAAPASPARAGAWRG